MHGDYQFANVMFRHGAPPRLAAIVDWEMGTVGDPKLDLGWVVQTWPDDTSGDAGTVGGYVDMTGMPVARRAPRSATPSVSGRQVDDIDYYCVLAKWKLAVVLGAGLPAEPATTRVAPGLRPRRARAHAERRRPGRDERLPGLSRR